MEIKRPDWHEIGWKGFNKWFDAYIEPINKMFREGVEVYSDLEPGKIEHWNRLPNPDRHSKQKALLINIQPIKKESAEDVLREFVWAVEHKDDVKIWDECYERAKRVLEGK